MVGADNEYCLVHHLISIKQSSAPPKCTSVQSYSVILNLHVHCRHKNTIPLCPRAPPVYVRCQPTRKKSLEHHTISVPLHPEIRFVHVQY